MSWTYQRLEKQRVGSAQINERARHAETDLIDAIEQSDDNDGNIGTLARTALKRLPSNIYWRGLGVWGIRAFIGSQAQYHRSLDLYYMQLARHGARLSERDTEHDDLVVPNWHGGLVEPPSTFPRECSLRLTRGEAEYLAERIRLSPASASSLLAELVAQGQGSDNVPFVWQCPHAAGLPPNLRELVEHAQNFSEVMHGAPLLYNLILAEQAKLDDGITKYRERFAEWADSLFERYHVIASWKRERFWD